MPLPFCIDGEHVNPNKGSEKTILLIFCYNGLMEFDINISTSSRHN